MHCLHIVLNVCNLIAVSGNEEAVWGFHLNCNSIMAFKFVVEWH